MAFILFFTSACGGKKQKEGSVTLTGAGATFPAPFYNLAFKEFQKEKSVNVTYGGVGSGGGIRSLKDKIVDFAGTDAFLSDDEMADMPGEVLHIPTCMGAVVMGYNIPGVDSLRLTGELIAEIYAGNITNWRDAKITSINEGVTLPDLTINPVYRSDGSGTTYVFSDYLSKVSNSWKENVGTGKALKWPAGIAAKGNPGVAGTISQTAGSIGYIGSEYAFALKIPVAAVQNSSGNYIYPGSEGISAAGRGDLPADTRAMITNSVEADAYPISCFTWILIYKEQNYNGRSEAQAKANLQLLDWMLGSEAQNMALKVHYASLPAGLIANSKQLLEQATYNGNTLLK
ncbi:MAG: phosphate ABC transporter substrate-binding protein PstS [Odoribacter sp.]|nr:phosphate ABC transporter substrate-binding protein PstS [Odoribacter sp.]